MDKHLEKIFNNEELNKTKAEHYEKSLRLILKAIIKKSPKEILIKILKEEKIIKRDWCEKGEGYTDYESNI